MTMQVRIARQDDVAISVAHKDTAIGIHGLVTVNGADDFDELLKFMGSEKPVRVCKPLNDNACLPTVYFFIGSDAQRTYMVRCDELAVEKMDAMMALATKVSRHIATASSTPAPVPANQDTQTRSNIPVRKRDALMLIIYSVLPFSAYEKRFGLKRA